VIAAVIIGTGIIALIVSGNMQTPAAEIFPASGWSSGDNILIAPASRAARPAPIYILPAVRTDGRSGNNDRLVCTVAVEQEPELVQPLDGSYCTLIGNGASGQSCGRRFVHNCIGDFPSDDDPPAIQEVANRKRV
jgi:hypothetical protein